MPFPYSSKDIEGTDGGSGKYPPIPDDYYDFQITEVKEKLTKKNDPMVSLTLEITSPIHTGRRVWHNVTFPKVDPATGKPPKWAGMSVHFLKTIGEPWEGDYIVTPDAWIGKQFKAKTKTVKDLNGNKKSEIAFILGPDDKITDETVPF
jgi:hypothetical protein